MPSPIGHALVGLALVWSEDRFSTSALRPTRRLSVLAIACAALAVVPDLDLLVPGSHRTATHSLSAVVLVTIGAALATQWATGRLRWRVALICGAAFGSHLLLDWLGGDMKSPPGLQLFWPFSSRWFISEWTVFRAAEVHRLLSATTILWNVKTIALELLILAPFVLVLWFAGRRPSLDRSANQTRDRQPGQRIGAATVTRPRRGI